MESEIVLGLSKLGIKLIKGVFKNFNILLTLPYLKGIALSMGSLFILVEGNMPKVYKKIIKSM